MDTKKLLDEAWKIAKALPKIILKTNTGRYLVALGLCAVAKSLLGYELTIGDAMIIVAGIFGTLYGNETAADVKKLL